MISILEIYMHILDLTSGTKVFSENPMALDAEIESYLLAHLESFFEGLDIGHTQIEESSHVAQMMKSENFKDFSLQIADAFLRVMEKTEEIKPCDLVCILFSKDEVEYVAAIKLNFKTSFSHHVEVIDTAITNKIVMHHTTLPPKSQKLEEGILIALHEQEAWIKDRQVTIDGKKTAYITEEILGIPRLITPKRAINEMTKAAEKTIEKFQDNPRVATAKVRAVIEDMIDHYGHVDASLIAEKCFETVEEKEAFEETVAKKGVDQAPWDVPDSQKSKIRRTQKIKTSSGVEIVVPYAYMAREENIEIINHPDGSVSIELKNLGELL